MFAIASSAGRYNTCLSRQKERHRCVYTRQPWHIRKQPSLRGHGNNPPRLGHSVSRYRGLALSRGDLRGRRIVPSPRLYVLNDLVEAKRVDLDSGSRPGMTGLPAFQRKSNRVRVPSSGEGASFRAPPWCVDNRDNREGCSPFLGKGPSQSTGKLGVVKKGASPFLCKGPSQPTGKLGVVKKGQALSCGRALLNPHLSTWG